MLTMSLTTSLVITGVFTILGHNDMGVNDKSHCRYPFLLSVYSNKWIAQVCVCVCVCEPERVCVCVCVCVCVRALLCGDHDMYTHTAQFAQLSQVLTTTVLFVHPVYRSEPNLGIHVSSI